MLPLFHLHSFVIISFIIGLYCLLSGKYKKILPFAVVAVPIATVFVLYSTNLFRNASVIHIKAGWDSKGNLLAFWWQNIGPWMLVFIFGLAMVMWKGTLKLRLEWAGIILLLAGL